MFVCFFQLLTLTAVQEKNKLMLHVQKGGSAYCTINVLHVQMAQESKLLLVCHISLFVEKIEIFSLINNHTQC